MLRTIIVLTALAVCGCTYSDQSRWESSLTASSRVRVDSEKPVDHVDLSASLRRNW